MPHLGEFTHGGQCVVRTPLLAFNVLRNGLNGDRLRLLIAAPIVREALFLAMPELDAAIDDWLADTRTSRTRDVESMLVRHITRMAFRPTPFGLFSGCAAARIAETTSLRIGAPSECRRSSRLDMQYLRLVAEALEHDPHIRATLQFRPNSSLSIADDEARYFEGHSGPTAPRVGFRLIEVESTRPLMAALEASTSATAENISNAIVRSDNSISHTDASNFVDELIDAQILESNILPSITCEDPVGEFIATLAANGATRDVADLLADGHCALRAVDATGLGIERGRYRAIVDTLQQLPAAIDPARLFHVDLFKPNQDFRIGEHVIDELRGAIELLHRITAVSGPVAMRNFRQQFVERYGDREVSLGEALDEERGLGFEAQDVTMADWSPLLAEVALKPQRATSEPTTAQERYKLRSLLTLLESGHREWLLKPHDLDALAIQNVAPLPDAIGALFAIAANGSEAVDRGEFDLFIRNVWGPTGAALLGRFCHGDATVRSLVERHLRAEEACRPDAIFAEIVHLPEGQSGNLLCRPVLRSHEIPYLGISGAPLEQQIEIGDLRLCVRHGAVRLRSARLNREVLPRLSSAHNHQGASLAIYRFLCALQYEGLAYSLRWTWGMLDGAPFLPRVRHGRIVLSLATWTMDAIEVEHVVHNTELRARRGLPRWVCVADADDIVPIDLDSDSGCAQLLELARGHERLQIQELLPDPDNLCTNGADGRYTHEMVVPFARTQRLPVKPLAATRTATSVRTFLPGTEWLYAKIYAGPATSDRVLRTVIAPLVRDLRTAKWITRWFFTRHADPAALLRVHLQGDPEQLMRNVVPLLRDRIAPLLAAGRVARFQIDTYEREIELYGGERAMLAAERIFAADSDAALGMLAATTGEQRADVRWRLALYGMHTMLADAGFDDASRHRFVVDRRNAFASEHQSDSTGRRSLGMRYLTERAAIERLVGGFGAGDAEFAPILSIVQTRSEAMIPAFADLHALDDTGDLETSWQDLIGSFLRMHINRLIRSGQHAHEIVLYDFLHRAYDSAATRSRESFSSGPRNPDRRSRIS